MSKGLNPRMTYDDADDLEGIKIDNSEAEGEPFNLLPDEDEDEAEVIAKGFATRGGACGKGKRRATRRVGRG
jgi:hypothetical protein